MNNDTFREIYSGKLRLCSCGNPELRLRFIATVLTAQQAYRDSIEQDFKLRVKTRFDQIGINNDHGHLQFILDQLSEANLLEHDGSVANSRLTSVGKQFLEFVTARTDEQLESILDYQE